MSRLLLTGLVLAVLLAAAAGSSEATSARSVAVKIYAPRGDVGASCDRVLPLTRSVSAPGVLSGAMRALLRGPTAGEHARGFGGWFSRRTGGYFRSATIVRRVAQIDFRNFSHIVPNASSSCGSALLLAQLDRTALQFPTVRAAVYSFGGSTRAFYEWLQRSPPTT